MKADDITREKIYAKNGGVLWADDEENGMVGLYRAILSVDDFKPIGYMVPLSCFPFPSALTISALYPILL